jgi:hypothetical protein
MLFWNAGRSIMCHIFATLDHPAWCRGGTRIARGSEFSGPGRHPAEPCGYRLPLPLALAILLPSFSDIGDYTDRATSRINTASRARYANSHDEGEIVSGGREAWLRILLSSGRKQTSSKSIALTTTTLKENVP